MRRKVKLIVETDDPYCNKLIVIGKHKTLIRYVPKDQDILMHFENMLKMIFRGINNDG